MVNSIASSLVVLACVSTAFASQVVREISWSEMAGTGGLKDGEIQTGGPEGSQEQLKVDNPSNQPTTVTLLDLKDPGVSTLRYAVRGSVRYEEVAERSYLEMWSWFADGSEYFSRTLSDSGPMQSLAGTSDWRPFTLPFSSDEKLGTPVRVVINVVLADSGTVYVSPLELVQYSKEWWSDQTGGWIGGIGGSIIGILGATIGTLAGMGKARRFVLALTTALVLTGVALLVLGVIAVLLEQPYGVYYPLLLGGIILAAVCGGNLRTIRRRYDQIGLRKMAAMDVGR